MRIALPSATPVPAPPWRWALGVDALDAALGGGIAAGRLHEVYAADGGDAWAAMGFVAAATAGMTGLGMNGRGADMLWLRPGRAVGCGGVPQGNGWAEMGGTTAGGLWAVVADNRALLRAAADAVRCPALGAVVIESWRTMPELDLTASRRLALAAEKSGVPLFLLRLEAEPVPSAAQTRWQVAAAPSHALPGKAPGLPTFDIELLRQRSGPSGLRCRLEWDRDQRKFREATLSGAVVSLPFRGPAADGGSAGTPRADRDAA